MSALSDAAIAVLTLEAALRAGHDPQALPAAPDALSALERLIEAGGYSADLAVLLATLRTGDVVLGDVEDARQALAEMALQDALSTPRSTPAIAPPSGDTDGLADEVTAALAATGDTLPPESGDVPLGWMAVCTGSDTEPCPAGGSWDDAATYVP